VDLARVCTRAVSTTTRSPIGAKTAIITGGGIDIGLSSAFAFAEAGYHDRYGCPAGEQPPGTEITSRLSCSLGHGDSGVVARIPSETR
jgi:hypothetical protein